MLGRGKLFGTMIVSLFASATALQAQVPAPPTQAPAQPPAAARTNADATEQCLRTEIEAVPVRSTPFVLQARLASTVGERISAEFPEESKLQLVSIERDPEQPLVVRMTLNTSAAAAGEWAIAVQGEGGRCAGRIVVAAATPRSATPERPSAPAPDQDR